MVNDIDLAASPFDRTFSAGVKLPFSASQNTGGLDGIVLSVGNLQITSTDYPDYPTPAMTNQDMVNLVEVIAQWMVTRLGGETYLTTPAQWTLTLPSTLSATGTTPDTAAS